jgi:hypothetical protein
MEHFYSPLCHIHEGLYLWVINIGNCIFMSFKMFIFTLYLVDERKINNTDWQIKSPKYAPKYACCYF